MFEADVTAVTLSWLWYQPGKPWRYTLCKVDEDFMRVKPFTTEAPTAGEALYLATKEALEYKFPEIPRPAIIEDLKLELDL